jgi:hypothetical protein
MIHSENMMSVTTLQGKQKSRQLVPPKEKREERQQDDVWLTTEEIERLTEPGHRKRSAEICRELALKIMSAE